MINLKDLANAKKEVLKSQTKSMVDTVDPLKEKYSPVRLKLNKGHFIK